LAATGDEHAEDAILLQQRVWAAAQVQHRLAHRIADQVNFISVARLQPLGIRIARGDRVDAARDQAVDAAEHGVLLVHRGRNAGREGGGERGERGIAAEADHRGGLQ